MYLQGDLQAVFDALYTVGAIDPVLKMDWEKVNDEMEAQPQRVHEACRRINTCSGDIGRIVEMLRTMDPQSVNFVALEVAREFCEFQDRKELH